MRILILCVATFAAGILAGSLFMADEGTGRTRTREAAREAPEFERRTSSEWDIEKGHVEAGSSGESRRTENPNVRRLTAGARQALARFETGEVATLLSEADGTISGVVLDPSGRPVPGVVVTAVPETRPFDLVANWRAARKTP
ncbi:MAG: carboxypeptidase-like regulatory domain-containing protein, partial [Planctomycetota bacterium]